MTLDRMRCRDRGVGSAVCLVLSMVHRLVSLVRPTRAPVSPRNILIIEISEMGCLVLACPMLEALRRRYPEAILYFLMFEKIRGGAHALYLAPRERPIPLRNRNRGRVLADAGPAGRPLRPVQVGTGLVLLNPGGGELPIRAWPLANYVQLAEMLLETPDLAVGVVGLAGDRVWYERMADTIRSPRFFNLAGLTVTVREIVQVFNQCDVLVTSDGGLAHFAGLSSIHCIVFFGPETPVPYGPLTSNYTCLYAGISCSPCLSAYNARKSPCDGDNVCVKLFTPGHVKGLVIEALKSRMTVTRPWHSPALLLLVVAVAAGLRWYNLSFFLESMIL